MAVQPLTLLVKAPKDGAYEAARAHGFTPWAFRENGHGETIVVANGSVGAAHDWFAEDLGVEPPYPAGSLLWFTDKSGEDASDR